MRHESSGIGWNGSYKRRVFATSKLFALRSLSRLLFLLSVYSIVVQETRGERPRSKPLMSEIKRLIVWIALIVTSTALPFANAVNVSASLGVIAPTDLGIVRHFRGNPLPQSPTIELLHHAQLDLYRKTVRQGGDGELPLWAKQQFGLDLQIRPFKLPLNYMTLGSSFYSILWVVQTMFHPSSPADGFWEFEWKIINRMMRPPDPFPMGYISLRISPPGLTG